MVVGNKQIVYICGKKWPTITGANGASYNAYTMPTCWQVGPPGLRDTPQQAKIFLKYYIFQ
jgi:hypothetical protein